MTWLARRHDPALTGVGARHSPEQLKTIVQQGAGRMPSFASLPDEETAALIDYVLTGRDKAIGASAAPAGGLVDRVKTFVKLLLGRPTASAPNRPTAETTRFTGYKQFLDPEGFPAIEPHTRPP